jgi:hypothetical protein
VFTEVIELPLFRCEESVADTRRSPNCNTGSNTVARRTLKISRMPPSERRGAAFCLGRRPRAVHPQDHCTFDRCASRLHLFAVTGQDADLLPIQLIGSDDGNQGDFRKIIQRFLNPRPVRLKVLSIRHMIYARVHRPGQKTRCPAQREGTPMGPVVGWVDAQIAGTIPPLTRQRRRCLTLATPML